MPGNMSTDGFDASWLPEELDSVDWVSWPAVPLPLCAAKC